tara:strand:- start:15026 stop:15298 length:273 start_codon:yes stop_codon:yes gene_type:complete
MLLLGVFASCLFIYGVVYFIRMQDELQDDLQNEPSLNGMHESEEDITCENDENHKNALVAPCVQNKYTAKLIDAVVEPSSMSLDDKKKEE